MGVTIHFTGIVSKPGVIAEVLALVRSCAAENDWAAEPINAEQATLLRFFSADETPDAFESSRRRLADKPGHEFAGEIRGVTIFPHDDCEPLRFVFDSTGYVEGTVKTEFAGVEVHRKLIALLRQIEPFFHSFHVVDEGDLWESLWASDDVELWQQAFTRSRQSIGLLMALLPEGDAVQNGVKDEQGRIHDIVDASGRTYNAAVVEDWSSDEEHLQMLASHGVGLAMWKYGQVLLSRELYDQGVSLVKQAAEQELAFAEFQLGECFRKGWGVDFDYARAQFWYAKASKQGLMIADDAIIGRYHEEYDEDYTADDFREAAEAGDPYAQYRLALCYWIARGVEEDATTAANWLEKSADAGFADSQFYYGSCLRDASGRETDFEAAVKWFSEAAAQGNALAQEALGFARMTGQGVEQNEEWAVRHFTAAAELGLPNSMGALGDCYVHGTGVEANHEQAFLWYQKASDLEHSMGAASVGECYLLARGVELNETLAVQHFRRAIQFDSENAFALCSLAECYQRGTGVAQDAEKAVHWYRLAAKLENAYAQFMIGEYYEADMNDLPSFELAHQWYAKAAQHGFPPAFSRLAAMNYDGRGVEKNSTEAFQLWSQGHEAGDEQATTRLGMCYEHGIGADVDFEKAVSLYVAAAENNDSWAMTLLGLCAMRGRAGQPNTERAVEWYMEAVTANQETAMLELAFAHEYGIGVEIDVALAEELYSRATVRTYEPIPLGRFADEIKENKSPEANTTLYWTRRAAEQNEPWALNNLGAYYQAAHGVAPDFELAIRCYQQAADFGLTTAHDNLAYAYEMGMGVRPSAEQAIAHYQIAAENGCIGALCSLGYFFHHGIGVDRDLEQAIHWYSAAANQGDDLAACRLASLYENGIGVEQSYDEALKWYRQANTDAVAQAAVRRIEALLQQPSEQDSFANKVIEAITENGETRTLIYDREKFHISPEDDTSFFLNLANFYHEYYAASPDVQQVVIERILRSWNTTVYDVPETFDEATEDILPAVRPLTYFESLRHNMNHEPREVADLWPHVILGDHLAVALVYDMQESMLYITNDMLESWAITVYELFESARENLLDLAAEPFIAIEDGLFQANGRDSYDASRILLTDEIKQLEISGDIIAMAPNRETLFIADAAHPQALSMMIDRVYSSLNEPRAISELAFHLVDDEWRLWLPPRDHSLYEDFKSLQLKYFRTAYQEQKVTLESQILERGEPTSVADYSIAVNHETKEPFSYCVWTPGDWLLPRCEQIVLSTDHFGERDTLHVSWEKVFRKFGARFSHVESYPERFRVSGGLTKAEINSLK